MTAPAQEQMQGLIKVGPEPDWAKADRFPPTGPTVYDPPQFRPDDFFQNGFLKCASRTTFFFQTGGCCMTPAVPCCCATCARYCCHSDAFDVDLLDSVDSTLLKMLSYSNPNCPERLRGVWWMDGNQSNQESIVAFQDADWVDGTKAVKKSYENWVRVPTCFGMIGATPNWLNKGKMDIFLSPDKKWISIGNYPIYVLGPDDVLNYPDGSKVPREPKDMMRIDMNPDGTVTYQYMVRLIAYLDDDNKLVKTKNFDRMQELLKAGAAKINSCGCHRYFASSTGPDWANLSQEMRPWGIIRYPTKSS
mmetsp:Transcript_80943/g.212493  ORF Transcript_80943/g.212493 Transcript_80943/m.212493 type:complete len:305 (-) Transcript_80943:8-922(-)